MTTKIAFLGLGAMGESHGTTVHLLGRLPAMNQLPEPLRLASATTAHRIALASTARQIRTSQNMLTAEHHLGRLFPLHLRKGRVR